MPLKKLYLSQNEQIMLKCQNLLKKLDMQIHRGGDRVTINEAQRAVEETVQDIIDIVEREA